MKLVKIFALFIFVTTLMLSFQNCSPSQNKTLLGSNSSGITEAEAVNINAPFAYDMVVDTISYNSCVGTGLNANGLFGIKMGVNEGFVDRDGKGTVKAGLKLRTDFLTYIGKNVSAIYPSTVITPSQIEFILQNSTANKNARVQYAIRKKTDLSIAVDVIQPSGSDPVIPGRDGQVEVASLASDPVLTHLTKNIQFGENGVLLSEGQRVYNLYSASAPQAIQATFGYSNYVDETYPLSTISPTPFENFGIGEAYSDRVRQRFNSAGTDKYVATVTYGDPTKGTSDYGLSQPLRMNSASADKTKAYGRGYAFRFDAASTRAGWKSNQLRAITETNLVDGTPVTGGTSWSCENYVIMKDNQLNNARPDQPGCSQLTASDMQNSAITEKVKRLRRHYTDDEWSIGLFYAKNSIYAPAARAAQPLCLVPKKASCYLPTGLPDGVSDMGVNYDPNTECYLYAYSVMGVSYTGNPGIDAARALGRCAQYASICVRTSGNY